VKPALGIARVVDDDAVEDLGVGNAHVVAVEGHHDDRARGEAHHVILMPLDVHPVIVDEWLLHAEQNAGDVVLHRVAQGEPAGQTE
jgi:hypothetical protein